jgi:hypothetical protein
LRRNQATKQPSKPASKLTPRWQAKKGRSNVSWNDLFYGNHQSDGSSVPAEGMVHSRHSSRRRINVAASLQKRECFRRINL